MGMRDGGSNMGLRAENPNSCGCRSKSIAVELLRSTIGERSPKLGVPVVTYHVISQA